MIVPPSGPTNHSDDHAPREVVDWVRQHTIQGEPRVDTDAAWTRFAAANDLRKRRQSFVPAAAWRIAALIVIAAGIGVWRIRGGSSGAEMVERVAANGERAVITLDDGSRVTLKGGSKLRYTPKAGGDRDVYLEGEGFFEVTHDVRRAFRVHAARGVVRDIGTKFNVLAYSGQPSIEVAVLEGSVALGTEANASAMTLVAGEVGKLDSAGVATRVDDDNIERHVGWTSGALIFERTSLAAVGQELEHRYGVRITVDPSLARREVTARFHGEPVNQVLDAVMIALGARYERQGSNFTITPVSR